MAGEECSVNYWHLLNLHQFGWFMSPLCILVLSIKTNLLNLQFCSEKVDPGWKVIYLKFSHIQSKLETTIFTYYTCNEFSRPLPLGPKGHKLLGFFWYLSAFALNVQNKGRQSSDRRCVNRVFLHWKIGAFCPTDAVLLARWVLGRKYSGRSQKH